MIRVKYTNAVGHTETFFFMRGLLARNKTALRQALLGKIPAPALIGWEREEYGREDDAPRNLEECAHALSANNSNWGTDVCDVTHYIELARKRFRESA